MQPTSDALRAARKSLGLSQTAAAAVIGRSLRVWQAYEDGTRGIDPLLWLVWRIRVGLAAPDSILAM
jgi:predicted transcriptional regulator